MPVRTLASTAAYSLWASAYPPVAHNRLMHIEQAAMLAMLPPLNSLSVIDLACGSGRYARIAREQGARVVAGVDDSASMLREAQRSASLAVPIQGDLTALPFRSGTFDVAICGLALGHLLSDRMRTAIAEIARMLKPGGIVALSDFHPFQYLNGKRRTFIAPNGTRYAVEHYPHLVANYFEAFSAAGLGIDRIVEPLAPETQQPAVLILRGRKD